jgi:hypothetical protein
MLMNATKDSGRFTGRKTKIYGFLDARAEIAAHGKVEFRHVNGAWGFSLKCLNG